MGKPGALKRQAKKASGKAALQAWRAFWQADAAVERAEEYLAQCERTWRKPWKVETWRDATMLSAEREEQQLCKYLDAKIDTLAAAQVINREELQKVEEEYARKSAAAAKSENLSLAESRERQAKREYADQAMYLNDRNTEIVLRSEMFDIQKEQYSDIGRAALEGSITQLRKLLQANGGLPPTRQDFAAGLRNGSPVVVDILLQFGVDVNERDPTGSTFLHGACHRGQTEMVVMLLEVGADVHALNRRAQMPLHLACSSFPRYRKTEICFQLLLAGASTEAEDQNGSTPLEYAARCADLGAIKLVLDVGISTEQIETALAIATGQRDRAIELRADKERNPNRARAAMEKDLEAAVQLLEGKKTRFAKLAVMLQVLICLLIVHSHAPCAHTSCSRACHRRTQALMCTS
jgi:ankyrin repeat protein